jgi:hypothetical protein
MLTYCRVCVARREPTAGHMQGACGCEYVCVCACVCAHTRMLVCVRARVCAACDAHWRYAYYMRATSRAAKP